MTGEKRKIRKTYKGKIQAFGLAGRNQEVKHPEGQPGGLVEMMQWPEEEWRNQKVVGKEVEKGLDEVYLAKLERAMKMQPGPLPGFDAGVLGLDGPTTTASSGMPASNTLESRKTSPVAVVTAAGNHDGVSNSKLPVGTKAGVHHGNGGLVNTTANTGSAATTGVAAPPGPSEPMRPRRAGKKRRYDDRSFEGYEEGFIDDDGYDDENDDGSTLGGPASSTTTTDDRRSLCGTKKRRKVSGFLFWGVGRFPFDLPSPSVNP